MKSERMREVDELKAEIRRLEAEESAANSGDRLANFQEAVSKTGYFRRGACFYRTKAEATAWVDEDNSFNVDVDESTMLLCYSNGNVSFEVWYRDGFSGFEPEEVFPISAEEYQAAKTLIASVRSQVQRFKEKYKDHES